MRHLRASCRGAADRRQVQRADRARFPLGTWSYRPWWRKPARSVTRSPHHPGNEEYLLASIQQRGIGRVEQDGRARPVSRRPRFLRQHQALHAAFDKPFHQLVVQIPKRDLMLRDTPATDRARARPGHSGRSGRDVLYVRGSARQRKPGAVRVLLPARLGLLSRPPRSRAMPTGSDGGGAARERALDFLRRTPDRTRAWTRRPSRRRAMRRAALCTACSAMRACGATAPDADRACPVMLLSRTRTASASVGFACGFESESGFHARSGRLRHDAGEYRRAWHSR
jgi:hypothetical protein